MAQSRQTEPRAAPHLRPVSLGVSGSAAFVVAALAVKKMLFSKLEGNDGLPLQAGVSHHAVDVDGKRL
jgi:hypothetical protein